MGVGSTGLTQPRCEDVRVQHSMIDGVGSRYSNDTSSPCPGSSAKRLASNLSIARVKTWAFFRLALRIGFHEEHSRHAHFWSPAFSARSLIASLSRPWKPPSIKSSTSLINSSASIATSTICPSISFRLRTDAISCSTSLAFSSSLHNHTYQHSVDDTNHAGQREAATPDRGGKVLLDLLFRLRFFYALLHIDKGGAALRNELLDAGFSISHELQVHISVRTWRKNAVPKYRAFPCRLCSLRTHLVDTLPAFQHCEARILVQVVLGPCHYR
ncbi:hypothetical protein LIA77_01466 [Sarocladium implicatum]|nr:hypothetical protein LIA77_01466 [Sarocladium implicatum]